MKYLVHPLETKRLWFRAVSLADFNDWLPFFADARAWQHWPGERLAPEEECRKWYARQAERYASNLGGMNALADKSTGKLVGHAGLLVQEVDGVTELEVAYSILPRYWGLGFATEAAIACRNFAFANHLAGSLISIIALSNTASQKVARNNGMKPEKETLYRGHRVFIFRVHKTDIVSS